MRYLVFSDIHGNLEALKAVLGDAEKQGYDEVVCLGDFVGYGASPNECVELVQKLNPRVCVLGNHDAAALKPEERAFFNPVAREAIIYTEKKLSAGSSRFLKNLAYEHVIDDTMFVHSSPYMSDRWHYVLDVTDAQMALDALKQTLAFVGHTHIPAIHRQDGTSTTFPEGTSVRARATTKTIVNVGSVGQPRDGDPRSAYVIYDDEGRTAEIFRVPYDIDLAAKRILDEGLPPVLAYRLRTGN